MKQDYQEIQWLFFWYRFNSSRWRQSLWSQNKNCHFWKEYFLSSLLFLKTIPVLYDLDFAHTQPLFTIAIGAQVTVDTETMSIRIDE